MSKRNSTLQFLLSFMFVISTVATGIMPVSSASTFTDVPDEAYDVQSVGSDTLEDIQEEFTTEGLISRIYDFVPGLFPDVLETSW